MKAHNVEQDQKMRKFDSATARLNANTSFRRSLNYRIVLETFNAQMKEFIQMRNADSAASGVAYEFSECEELLEDLKA